MRPDIVVPTYLTPYPGTELYEKYQESLKDYNLDEFSYLDNPICFLNIPVKQLRKFRTKILLNFYLNPFILLRTLLGLNKLSRIRYFLLEIRSLLVYFLQ